MMVSCMKMEGCKMIRSSLQNSMRDCKMMMMSEQLQQLYSRDRQRVRDRKHQERKMSKLRSRQVVMRRIRIRKTMGCNLKKIHMMNQNLRVNSLKKQMESNFRLKASNLTNSMKDKNLMRLGIHLIQMNQ